MKFPTLLRFLKTVLLAAIILSLSRLVFLVNSYSIFADSGAFNLALAFLHGIRFDLVTIAYALIPIWLWLIFFPKKGESLFGWSFLSLIGLCVFANAIDTEFFKFTGKRMTSDIFRFIFLSDDAQHIGLNILFSFWYLVVSWCLIMYLSYIIVIRNNFLKSTTTVTLPRSLIQIIIIIGSVFLMMRGGIQKIPLSIFHAGDVGDPSNSVLVLNSPFTYIKTLGSKSLIEPTYMTVEKAKAQFNPEIILPQNIMFGSQKGKNVVILIVESLSKEYVGAINHLNVSYTPFLDSLATHSLVCTNAFANGHRSIDGIPAVISAIPSLMYEPYITSTFSINKQASLGYLLGEQGYSTLFFHGGNEGTMGFNSFTNTAGIKKYIGRNSYPDQSKYDGHWGIYDNYFLDFVSTTLTSEKQPFLAVTFTLSSHHPYSLPKEFENTFPTGSLPNHESVGYADNSLRLFFKKAKEQPWYNNTVFLITSDHTSLTEGGYYNSFAGKLSVPIFFFTPNDSLMVGEIDEVCSHVDIVPSVLHLLGYDAPFVSFGRSVFDPLAAHQNIVFTRDQYQIIKNGKLLRFDGENATGLYNLSKDSLQKRNLLQQEKVTAAKMTTSLKAYLQQFADYMYSNKMRSADEQ